MVLKCGDPNFKSVSDHELDLFKVVSGSNPWLCLYIDNRFASCELGFFNLFRSF